MSMIPGDSSRWEEKPPVPMPLVIEEQSLRVLGRKRWIYVTGASADAQLIRQVGSAVLRCFNCRVHYDPLILEGRLPEDPEKEMEIRSVSLAEMEMVVVVVTRELLEQEGLATSFDIPFAIAKNIAILPVLAQPGLEAHWDARFGHLHLLRSFEPDWETRLKESIEMHFDEGYWFDQPQYYEDCLTIKAFLSYRKCNYDLAVALIRTIQSLDIADHLELWIDDFLKVGEVYDDDIASALSRSQILFLLVTPQLLEPGNYVMEKEYPEAVRQGKWILPVLMEPVDQAALELSFPGIPPVIPPEALGGILQQVLQRLEPDRREPNAVQLVRMAIAYLEGHRVLRNPEKGRALLERAALMDDPDGCGMLGELLAMGHLLPFEPEMAVHWLKKSIRMLDQRYPRIPAEQHQDALHSIAFRCTLLNGILTQMDPGGHDPETEEFCKIELDAAATWYDECRMMSVKINPGNPLLRLSEIAFYRGDEALAAKYLNDAAAIVELFYQSDGRLLAMEHYLKYLFLQGSLLTNAAQRSNDGAQFMQAAQVLEEALALLFTILENAESQNYEMQQLRQLLAVLTSAALGVELYAHDVPRAVGLYEQLVMGYRVLVPWEYEQAKREDGIMQMLGTANTWLADSVKNYALAELSFAVVGVQVPDRELLEDAYKQICLCTEWKPQEESYQTIRKGIEKRLAVWPQNL